MDGFKRPQRTVRPRHAEPVAPLPIEPAAPEPVLSTPTTELPVTEQSTTRPLRPRRFGRHAVLTGLGAVLPLSVGVYLWYHAEIAAPKPSDNTVQRVEVKSGQSFGEISDTLYGRGLIKSQLAFDLYARIHGKRDLVKAGTCSLKPSETAGQILDKLTAGCHDFKSITFYPGATIEKPLYKPATATLDQNLYVKHILSDAGYSDSDIAAALGKTYDSPVFQDKPPGTSLEGYVFGETYYAPMDATVSQVLEETFAQMESIIKKDDLVAKFKAQGLNLYQGITLASIVQRELNCEGKPTEARKQRCYGYQQQIAQVFLMRLKTGMTLGSDVTFIYAADMMGVTPSPTLDSPYNTRIHTGLPPGPVSSPGELALQAVANPATTDYLYFIAGDDGLIYFAHTDAEHQANIKNHCQQLCSEL